MIRALFLDVDGTLVSFSTHRVPDSARRALLRAHERGVRIFIATGRAVGNLEIVAEVPYDGVVGLNGSDCVLRDGSPLVRHTIEAEDLERALALSDELQFPIAVEFDSGTFVNRLSPKVEQLARMVDMPVPQQTDLRELFAQETCCQLGFYLDPELEKAVMEHLPRLTASRWCDLFADINVAGADKGTGITEVAARFGFAREEIMAFGDGGNDVPMLRAAGIGVAMGNACLEALQAADYITADIDDDGLAKALRHFGVIE